MNKSTIQIWNSFEAPVSISDDVKQNKFQVEIKGKGEALTKELELKVEENLKANPKITDNPILFLDSINDNGQTISTNIRGFKYTHAFNRNKENHGLIAELNKYKLLSASTHCHMVTKDNKILFGTKKNQFNQISGFSGFPNVEEDSANVFDKRVLDVYKTMQNRLRPEIGYLVDTIDSINAIGMVYVDTKGLRGTDMDYLVKLDETASNVQKRFEETSQFKKRLFTIDFEPDKMRQFVETIHKQDKIMSRYALGCMYLETKAYFGEKEANKLLTIIRQDASATISTKNEMNYFKE